MLPFGHNCSPYFFTKVLRPVVRFFRQIGLRVVLYVDDFILFASREDISRHKHLFLDTLQELGWVVNFEKSDLDPSQGKEYIGYFINTAGDKVLITIPQRRVSILRRDIRRVLKQASVSARGLARICGQCVSMYKCVFPAKLFLRNSYRLLASKKSWSDILTLDQSTVNDLSWWLNALGEWNGLVVGDTTVDIQMVTDASGYGWGAWIPGHEAQGFWDRHLAYQSSNYRELFTVLMGLRSFRKFLVNKTVQVMSDNITTVALINKMGGAIQSLDQVARAIHVEAMDMNVKLVASYLSGVKNWHADQLSRRRSTYEWMLHPRLFGLLDKYWGPHQVDRFASLMTTQLPMYNSLFWDPGTSGVDALAQKDWGEFNNFVNAPFALIPRVLQVVKQQKAVATVIAPWWESQVWFRQLVSMSIEEPIRLPVSNRTVIAVGATEPLKNRAWQIYAWRISGTRG